jgi:hypothetical protein
MASIGHKRNNHYKEKNRPTQPSLGYVSEYMQQVGIVVSQGGRTMVQYLGPRSGTVSYELEPSI